MSYYKSHYHIYHDCLEKQKQKQLFRTPICDISHVKMPYLYIGGAKYLHLSANDYLGLSHHPDILVAAKKASDQYANNTASARGIGGGYDFFLQTEKKLAAFKGKPTAIIGASGFQVGSSILSALLKPYKNPLVFFDKYNHASLYYGVQNTGITPIRFGHNDLDHLEKLIQKHRILSPQSPIFIVTESVFSMDGDICNLKKLVKIADHHNAFTVIDDAHGVGVCGPNGRGLTYDHPQIDVVLGTCSKAMGCFGGYVACNDLLGDYFRNFASGLIYSTALPPFIWGGINKALDLIPQMSSQRERLRTLSKIIYMHLPQYLPDSSKAQSCHIIPILIGDNSHALIAQEKYLEKGFYIKAIRSPTVPTGTARLRLSLNPLISTEEILRFCEVKIP